MLERCAVRSGGVCAILMWEMGYPSRGTSRRRYRSMMAVSNEIPLSLGTFNVTSPEVVVRFRL